MELPFGSSFSTHLYLLNSSILTPSPRPPKNHRYRRQQHQARGQDQRQRHQGSRIPSQSHESANETRRDDEQYDVGRCVQCVADGEGGEEGGYHDDERGD